MNPAGLNLNDPWGHRLQVQSQQGYLIVRSAGPDGQLYSNDDRVMYVLNPWCLPSGSLQITQGRQADNGTATVTGIVTDPAGAIIAGARVELKNAGTGATYASATGAQGQLTVAGLPPGQYSLSVTVPGFKKLVRSSIDLGPGTFARGGSGSAGWRDGGDGDGYGGRNSAEDRQRRVRAHACDCLA